MSGGGSQFKKTILWSEPVCETCGLPRGPNLSTIFVRLCICQECPLCGRTDGQGEMPSPNLRYQSNGGRPCAPIRC